MGTHAARIIHVAEVRDDVEKRTKNANIHTAHSEEIYGGVFYQGGAQPSAARSIINARLRGKYWPDPPIEGATQ